MLIVEAVGGGAESKVTRADSCEGEIVLRGEAVRKLTDEAGRVRTL